jgi:DNA-binding transcriptional ArsR family regulator
MSALCGEIEKFGKGIGNATRYRIIEVLAKGPRTVSELVDLVHISQPAMSQHLAKLKASNLVTDVRCGQEVRYALHTEHILALLTNLVREVQTKGSKRITK